jgi:hypothetical protein
MNDVRATFLRRAERVSALYRGGRMDIDRAFNALIHPFLEIVGPAARLCRICGDPPWRHDDAWCVAVLDGIERRAKERPKPRPRTPQATIESLMHSVRAGGIKALRDPDNVERLARCDAAAKAQINQRIERLKKQGGVA